MKRAKSRRHRNRGHKPTQGGLSLNQRDHLVGPSTPAAAGLLRQVAGIARTLEAIEPHRMPRVTAGGHCRDLALEGGFVV
jgi:hypothetical protein